MTAGWWASDGLMDRCQTHTRARVTCTNISNTFPNSFLECVCQYRMVATVAAWSATLYNTSNIHSICLSLSLSPYASNARHPYRERDDFAVRILQCLWFDYIYLVVFRHTRTLSSTMPKLMDAGSSVGAAGRNTCINCRSRQRWWSLPPSAMIFNFLWFS